MPPTLASFPKLAALRPGGAATVEVGFAKIGEVGRSAAELRENGDATTNEAQGVGPVGGSSFRTRTTKVTPITSDGARAEAPDSEGEDPAARTYTVCA